MANEATVAFKQFIQNADFRSTIGEFDKLCQTLNLPTKEGLAVYGALKTRLSSYESKHLFEILDKKIAQDDYKEKECTGKSVLIVGAGPCGLRMSIECALLGARVYVIESRDYVSRNNVLHLWPFVIQDIKALGGKVFFPKFCAGGLEHISIKRLQLVMMKVALLFGVRILAPVTMEKIVPPDPTKARGWRVQVCPENHTISQTDYDFIIGASGKRSILPDFSKKCLRGKLAIAITANFINNQTLEDARILETGGLSYVFDQEFFNGLKQRTDIDLENYVYYKDETHYFVVTAKKQCLLKKGIIKKDFADPKLLLDSSNINPQHLSQFAYTIARETTKGMLTNPVLARNHRNEEDLAIFDFTAIHQATHSCFAREVHGRTLLQCLVGDSLLEPFWPVGTGCARGFLGVMDAAWLIKNWCSKEILHKLNLIAERECIFELLSQTSPNTLNKQLAKYSLNPVTRYGLGIKTKTTKNPSLFKHLYLVGDMPMSSQVETKRPYDLDEDEPSVVRKTLTLMKRKHEGTLNTKQLLKWYQDQLSEYQDIIKIHNLDESWRNGLAFSAIIKKFLPAKLNTIKLQREAKREMIQHAFDIIEEELDVSPLVSVDDLLSQAPVDKLAMLSYLLQLHDTLVKLSPTQLPQPGYSEIPLKKKVLNEGNQDVTDKNAPREIYSAKSLLRRISKKCYTAQLKVPAVLNVTTPDPVGDGDYIHVRTLLRAKSRKLTKFQRKKAVRKSRESSQSPAQQRKGLAQVHLADEKSHFGVPGSKIPSLLLREKDKVPDVQKSTANIRLSQPPPAAVLDYDPKTCQPLPKTDDSGVKINLAVLKIGKGESDERTKRLSAPGNLAKDLEKITTVYNHPARSDICIVCGKKLYLVERFTACGYFFHRQCFRCHMCSCMLRLETCTLKRDANGLEKFVCPAHRFIEFEVNTAGSKHPDKGLSDNGPQNLEDDTSDYQDVFPSADTDEELTEDATKPSTDQIVRMLEADEIQTCLNEVEEEEKKLEKHGLELEKKIRSAVQIDEAALNDWAEILQRKRDLVDVESKIGLKMKIRELKERHQRLILELEALELEDVPEDVLKKNVERLDKDTKVVEETLTQIMAGISCVKDTEDLIGV